MGLWGGYIFELIVVYIIALLLCNAIVFREKLMKLQVGFFFAFFLSVWAQILLPCLLIHMQIQLFLLQKKLWGLIVYCLTQLS